MTTMPTYRSVASLTDEEITKLMEIVYPTMGKDVAEAAEIVEIDRSDAEIIAIACTSCWHDCEDGTPQWCEEYYELSDWEGLRAFDVSLDTSERRLVKQYLFSLGCSELLRDNPYI